MKELFDNFVMYFSFPFVRYALIVGTLIALCSSLLGVTLVLKRFSIIGDGLSHTAFGAMSVAAVIGLTNKMIIAMPVTIISAIILLKSSEKRKIKGDAAIALVSVTALAVGYMVMNLFPSSSNITADVCTTLFGSISILTLTKVEVIICIVMSVLVVLLYILFYNKIYSITFDENFQKATGTKTDLYNLLLAVIIAVVIVLAMNLVGSLLISALIIFPALSSMRVCKNFKSVTICSVIVSVVCAVFGMLLSIITGTPVGPTIVITDLFVFLVFFVIGKLQSSKKVSV